MDVLKKGFSLCLLLFLFIFSCSNEEQTKDKTEVFKGDTDQAPLTKLLNSRNSNKPLSSNQVEADDEQLLSTLKTSHGIVNPENGKKSGFKYNHPTYFSSMVSLYYINNKGTFKYDSEKNKLIEINKKNQINDINSKIGLSSNPNSFIVLSANIDLTKLKNEIDKRIKDKKVADAVFNNLSNNKKILDEASLIEIGTILNLMNLSSAELNTNFLPLYIKNKSFFRSILSSSSTEKPLILIPYIPNTNNKLSSYLSSTLSNSKASKKGEFDLDRNLDKKDIINILWSGNGIIKSTDSQTHPSMLPFSLIDLYYITNEQVEKFDPFSKSLKTIKFGDYRKSLGRKVSEYKTRSSILIVKKNKKNNSQLFKGQDDSFYNHYLSISDKNSLNDLAFMQIGVALLNIRIFASDLGLAFQHFEVPDSKQSRMASRLSLKENESPVFIVPIGYKKK